METSLALLLPFLASGLLMGWWQTQCKKLYAVGPKGKGALGGGWLPAGVVTLTLFGFSLIPQEIFSAYVHPFIMVQFSVLTIIGLFTAGLGVHPDKTGTPLPLWKHVFAAVAIVAFSVSILGAGFLNIPFVVDKIIMAGLWIWVLRMFFIADRMDGLNIVHTIGILFGMAFLVKPIALITLPIIGATLAFLRFNRPKAILFWGEAGRLWLGVMVGGLWALGLNYTPNDAQSAALIIFLLPLLLNTTFTATPWHQRAQNMGLSDTQVLFRISSLYVVLFILGVLGFVSKMPILFLLLALGLLISVALRIRYLESSPKKNERDT